MTIILSGLVAGIVLGVIVYRGILYAVPIRLMLLAERRMLKLRNNATNTFFHGRGPRPNARQIVMPSPDLIYSSCIYDLSRGALRMSGALPPAGHYWSLSLYAHNTDNYFVLNDRELPQRQFDITVHPPMSRATGDGAGIVKSPSMKGIALVRMIQRRPDDLPLIQAAQQSIRCENAAPA